MLGDEGTLIGIAAVITAILAGLPGVIAAVYGRRIHKEVKNPNGSTTGLAVEEIHAAISTPPGAPSIGIVTADTNEVVKKKE